MHRSRVLSAWLTLALALLAVGCSRGECEQTCRRVAECKRLKLVGDRVPGDSTAPADPACMARCEAATDQYASCEGKKRECSAVLECIPYR